MFMKFTPAISPEALKKVREVRRWQIHTHTRPSLQELADWVNPVVAGWMNYYGRFYRPRYAPSSGASTATWCAGPGRNTGGCARSSARSGGTS